MIRYIPTAAAALLAFFAGGAAASADDLVVRMTQYEHSGCHVAGDRHLPAGAEDGTTVRLVYPGGARQCLEMISRRQQGCRMAVIFPATNKGIPWQPGEKDPTCLAEFSAEVPRCIAHYEIESAKCHRAEDSASESDSPNRSTPPNSVFDGTWLVTDKNVYGYTNTSVCTLSTRGSHVEERCDDGSVNTGTIRGQIADMREHENSFGADLKVVDENTLEFEYPFGRGTYKRR